MNCKRSINLMDGAAIEALDAAREAELRRHLAECPSCQKRFERERRLVAAIDRSLTQALRHAPVSDEADLEARLTARVRQRISEESSARATPGLRLPAAVAVVLAALVLCVLAWRVRRPAINQASKLSETAAIEHHPRSLRVMGEEANPGLKNGAVAPIKRSAHQARRARVRNQPARHPTAPEVLVPKNEMALVLELYNGVRTGKIDGASLLAVPPGFKREKDGTLASAPIEIEPIEIARLNKNPGSMQRQNNY